MEKEQDIALIKALRENPVGALKALHERYYSVLVSYARKFLLDHQEASADIVQDVFLNFFNAKARFQDIASVENYLFVSVKNLSIKFLRKRILQNKSFRELGGQTLPDDISNRYIEAEVLKYILLEVKKLPSDYREVLELTYLGLTREEIAAKLDTTSNNVSQLRRRAGDMIRVILIKKNLLDMPAWMAIAWSIWGLVGPGKYFF